MTGLSASEGGGFSGNRYEGEAKGNGGFIFFQTRYLCDGYSEGVFFLSVVCCFGGSALAMGT